MAEKPKNWDEIGALAKKTAAMKGHKVSRFPYRGSMPNVRTGCCEICYGCCWIAQDHNGRFTAGGRLLKYECGTPEAMGLLRKEADHA